MGIEEHETNIALMIDVMKTTFDKLGRPIFDNNEGIRFDELVSMSFNTINENQDFIELKSYLIEVTGGTKLRHQYVTVHSYFKYYLEEAISRLIQMDIIRLFALHSPQKCYGLSFGYRLNFVDTENIITKSAILNKIRSPDEIIEDINNIVHPYFRADEGFSGVLNIFKESILCFNSYLLNPSIILLGLVVDQLIPIIAKIVDKETQGAAIRLTVSFNKLLRDMEKGKAENRINNLGKLLQHPKIIEQLKTLNGKRASNYKLIADRFDEIRVSRNAVVHPSDKKTFLVKTTVLSSIFNFYEGILRISDLFSILENLN